LPEDINSPHDKGYKFLLSSRKVFLELLQSFVHLGWVEKIDPESLIKIDKSCILQDFNKKEADLIYRLKIKEQEVIFYVLIEMQSTVDFQMPYRLLLYMMEIWRDVLKNTKPETTERKDFKLPAIIPIVLFNGANNWTACQCYKEYLTGSGQFEEYILNFRYILIDVNRYDKKTLLELANLIGSVFLLDQKVGKDEVILRLKELIGVLQRFPPDDFNLFRMWLSSIATIGLSEKSKESIIKILEESNPEEVEKMVYNLAETLKKMEEDVMLAKEEGKLAREEGRLAREEGIKTVAKNLLAKNTNLDFIAEVTGLSIDEIKALQAENNDKIH
jgi:predicted transposase/invertase (TIGR01784 family)